MTTSDTRQSQPDSGPRAAEPAAQRTGDQAAQRTGDQAAQRRGLTGVTPFSTIGPFFKVMLLDRAEGTDHLAGDATRGDRISIEGRLTDGAGEPILDGLVEIWQADAAGRYRHPHDPRSAECDPAFSGFGRVSTGVDGTFVFHTIKPGAVAAPDGRLQAPHVLVSVLARGIMTRCWTRLYFEDESSTATDPVLALVPPERRPTLVARRLAEGRYRWDLALQGHNETAFFDA
jgi:protocatechuate 3,4-dioxygenase, alpha subunit